MNVKRSKNEGWADNQKFIDHISFKESIAQFLLTKQGLEKVGIVITPD